MTIATLPVSDMFVFAVAHEATQTRPRALDIRYPSSVRDDTSHSYTSALAVGKPESPLGGTAEREV